MASYFIFRCGNTTYQECLDRELFGQDDNMSSYVSKVKVGDIIFLHNVNSQIIEGPFFATTNGLKNIIPEAWKGRFPQQVKVEKKGNISKISKSSFEKLGLKYVKDQKYFDFQIPTDLGRKLIEEMGLQVDYESPHIKDFNPIDDIDIDFRLKYPAKYRCEDGHYVRSISEALIDNWLFSHNIVHSYEKKIPGEFMVCDFYVRNVKGEEVYIEFWGLDKSEDYRKRKTEKENIYTSKKLRLINIGSSNIQNLGDFLGDQLKGFM